MLIIFFIVSFLSSTIGVICGIGGGIIIKPVIDYFNMLEASKPVYCLLVAFYL